MKILKSYVNNNMLDRFSELPDSLILEILLLLEMRDVVRTTLLSKRWKDFWVTIPSLKFHDDGSSSLVKIRNFVNRTLTLWRGTYFREFIIRFSAEPLSVNMAQWVQFATERKVEDLCIQLYNTALDLFCPPQCLYECSSIRNLSLHFCYLRIRGGVRWDRLKTLELFGCVFEDEKMMNQIFSSSPRLETFTAYCIRPFQNVSIRSSSLKKLWMMNLGDDPSLLTIWAPNLQVFRYSGRPDIKCLLNDTSSLNEVFLNFPPDEDVAVIEALRQILPLIQHVATLQLSASCFQVLRDISISPLLNVKQLTIDSWLIELSDIVGLLECFPKLKMLVINWKPIDEQLKFDHAENYTESEANILKSNLLQLRTVVITTRYVYEASLSEFTVFLLKHAMMMEKMVIRREGVVNSEEMLEAAKKLISLQRSFPNVELILL